MIFIIVLISLSMFITQCASQECEYDPNLFTDIYCYNMESIEQLKKIINGTLNPYGPVDGLIKVLKLESCTLLDLTIHSFDFLSNLETLQITNSDIVRITSDFNDNTRSTDRSKGFPLQRILLGDNNIEIVEPRSFSSGLNNLLELSLQNNIITTISASTFSGSAIQNLTLEENQITHLEAKSFENLNNIKEIILKENKIKQVNATNFLNSPVWKLDLSSNTIDFIEPKSFSSLDNLYELDLSFNQLTRIEKDTFSGCSMGVLSLYFNQIEEIESHAFSDTKNFFKLYLTANKLTQISNDLFVNNGVSKVIHLDVSRNQIAIINTNTFSIPSLETLHFQSNPMAPIEPKAFDGTENLDVVILRNNSLTVIKGYTFSGSSVTVLNMGENRIEHIEPYAFEGTKNLSRLFLGHNLITRITKDMFPRSTIVNLKLEENPIVYIEPGFFGIFDHLRYLDIKSDELTEIPYFSPMLRALYLYGKKITTIGRLDVKNLDTLFLSSNRITRIDRDSLSGSALDHLYIEKNELSVIEPYAFENLTGLTKIGLTENKLTRIDKDTFAGSTVSNLDLSDNKISFIEPGAFHGLHLIELVLKRNELTKIPNNTFSGRTIEKLSLYGNKIETIEQNAFANVRNLLEVVLTANRITSIDKDIFISPTLKVLHLGNNEISKVKVLSFAWLSNLTFLTFLDPPECGHMYLSFETANFCLVEGA